MHHHTISAAVQRAQRHGWRAAGVAIFGNVCYTVLRRPPCRRAVLVAPTGRVFSAPAGGHRI